MRKEIISVIISVRKAFDTIYHQLMISHLKKKVPQNSSELGARENPLNLKECLPGSLRRMSRESSGP